MIGIVLAAGAGRRLRPYTDHLPKALIPVDGETTILDIALRNLAAVDVRDVVVVVGYAADAIATRRGELEKRHGVSLALVHNDKAETWNNAYSLWLARSYLREGALVLNGDTVHPVGVEETLLARATAPAGTAGPSVRDGVAGRAPDVILAVDDVKDLAEEEMKVLAGEDGMLRAISKRIDAARAYGEYIGATLVEPTAAEPLADALSATWRRDPGLYYEDGYQEYVDRGGAVAVAAIGAVDWVEVDDHADLRRAREIACRC